MIQIIPGVNIKTCSTKHSRCQFCIKSISKLDNRVNANWPWNGNWHILCYYKQMNELPEFTKAAEPSGYSNKRAKYVKEFYKKRYYEAIVVDAL